MFIFRKAPSAQVTLFNTKGRKKEAFEALMPGKVRMYSCGPTVYDYAHIGNLRSVLLSDITRRVFEYAGHKVLQVMNITDFGHLVGDADDTEDKMLVGLKREGLAPTMENMFAVARRYEAAFHEDIAAFGAKIPQAMPRASENVSGMIAYVHTLLDKGYAYTTSDGVYFDVIKFPGYGVLGGAASAEHSRVGVSSEKHDPRDFALWKFNPTLGWDAPWGKGFPGWHIECTAMSTRYLGKSFDIHTGGIDHIAVHHNNEIAQAEAANGKPYARYWLHNEFITIDAARVAKSLGNTITLRQVMDRGIPALAYRYWLLTAHYRAPMNFTWEALEGAKVARERALRAFADLPQGGESDATAYTKRFEEAIYDDLDTPRAIAVMWELIKDDTVDSRAKRAALLAFDRVLAIGFSNKGVFAKVPVSRIPDEVQALAAEREKARAGGDFGRADVLRQELIARGYGVEDTPKGPILKPVSSDT